MSVDEIYRRGSVAVWSTSMGPNGEVLAPEFNSTPSQGKREKFMTFNRIQSSVVTGRLRVVTP